MAGSVHQYSNGELHEDLRFITHCKRTLCTEPLTHIVCYRRTDNDARRLYYFDLVNQQMPTSNSVKMFHCQFYNKNRITSVLLLTVRVKQIRSRQVSYFSLHRYIFLTLTTW